jgi:hypothetical protein
MPNALYFLSSLSQKAPADPGRFCTDRNGENRLMTAFVLLLLVLIILVSPWKTAYCQVYPPDGKISRQVNPKISEVIGQISKDSIYQTILQVCSFGTRCVYAENRRQVAVWTVSKFRSIGYDDALIDSFRIINTYPPYDSIWEYNVSVTIPGSSSADQVYLVTSHPDSWNMYTDPCILAPGANDDGSGFAGMLEIARVLKNVNFKPFATIRFSTLSSEEIHLEGARHYARKAKMNHENLRAMFDLDMIAYPDSASFPVGVYQVAGDYSYWTGDLFRQCILTYTTLIPDMGSHYGGNQIPFWEYDFCVGDLIQMKMNERIHSVHDSVQYLDMEMCRESAQAYCAAVLSEHYVPVPSHVTARATNEKIGISWTGRQNSTLRGYNVYRGERYDSGLVKLNAEAIQDTAFFDLTATPGTRYYYRISSLNEDGFESTLSNPASSYLMTFDRDLLVIKDAPGGAYDPPDSLVTAFYREVFGDFEYDYLDPSMTGDFNPAVLGRYRRVAWLSSNLFEVQSPSVFIKNREEADSYLLNHGNLLLACRQPGYLIALNTSFNRIFKEDSTTYDLYRIREIQRKPTAMLSGAYPVAPGYDSIRVDSAKSLPAVPYHINNIEAVYPAPGGEAIYRFDSGFDTTESYGKMKGMPVGIEYMGPGNKLVILSLPLYYMEKSQAKQLINYILNQKFNPGAGIPGNLPGKQSFTAGPCYPDPVTNQVTIPFHLPSEATISLEIVNAMGKVVVKIPVYVTETGDGLVTLDCSNLPADVYLCVLRSDNGLRTARFIILR